MSAEIERLRREAARDPAALVKLCDRLVAEGQADEAVQLGRRGVGLRPTDVQLKLALGRALMAIGELQEAQTVLAEAARFQSPARAPMPSAAPVAYDREDRTDEQLEELEEEPTTARAPVPEPVRRRDPSPQPMPTRDSSPRMGRPAYQDGDPGRRPSQAPIDLGQLADRLLTGDGESDAVWEAGSVPAPLPDPTKTAWDAKRARSFLILWGMLVLVTGGIIGGALWRRAERAKVLAGIVEKADGRAKEATYEGDLAARDLYASAVRIDPQARKYFAMVALASGRLNADQGEDTDAHAWAMLRRSEREAARHKQDPDPRVDRELRQARALLALGRGETCPPLKDDEDGDIAARCAAQHGDVDGARRILAATLKSGGDAQNLRALLALGSIELGAGDLDAADAAYRRVLEASPQHPRALVGRALVALERGETPTISPPENVRLGSTTGAWFHLARGLAAMGREDDATANTELTAARKGIVRDGRLALLYGRARLTQGQVGEAEQAMRVAEHLDPNDGDVAVLDAEVALAKGFEDKVVSALSVGAPTPRKLAVLGRAQVLTGKYREAVSTLDAALARRPGDATALTYRQIARARLGDMRGALAELEKAAKTLKSTTPRYGLGLLAYERHDLLKARTELEKALEHNSESFRARALLGRVLRDLGKPKEALVELERAARDAPALASVHEALGRLYLDLGRDRDARGELRKVLDMPGKATADDQLNYAEATADLGLSDDATKSIKDAEDAGALKSKVDFLRLLVQSWHGPKDALVAAAGLEKLRKGTGAHDARLAIQTADAWRRAGDLKRAGDDLRAALYGDALHANLGLGRVELVSTDPSQAEASFKAALKAWDGGPYGIDDKTEARVGLARALLHRKAAAEAITALEPAFTEDPRAPEPRFWMAKAYLEQTQPDKARPHADKAVELDDTYADAWQLVGDLYRATDKARAKVAYKKYLELQPNAPDAKNVKKILAALK
jgi:tetratricopeptide (TPR) repeat protein